MIGAPYLVDGPCPAGGALSPLRPYGESVGAWLSRRQLLRAGATAEGCGADWRAGRTGLGSATESDGPVPCRPVMAPQIPRRPGLAGRAVVRVVVGGVGASSRTIVMRSP